LIDLFEWCPLPREDVGENGEGMDVYSGALPWREGGKALWWDRERD
jgi:hypothetical protein